MLNPCADGEKQSAAPATFHYIGSVRFFKHLILLILALLILIPTVTCVALGVRGAALGAEADRARKGEASALAALAQLKAETGPEGTPSPLSDSEREVEVEPLDYQALYPELYAPAAELGTINEEKVCYLTFDDGPSARTPEILEILDHYGVKATFFVVGKEDEQSKQWMCDIIAAGHTLGIHSASHNYQTIYASAEAFLEDYDRVYRIIKDATGTAPSISRFPGGSINPYNAACYADLISEVLRRGFVYFDWNVSSGDAAQSKTVPTATLTKNALEQVNSLRRAIVLMHDSADKTTTVAALPAIIEGYRDAGFTFAALTPEVKPIVYVYPN